MFERADVKRAVYAQIEAIAGPALVVGSSSSGIPCSTFTEGLRIGPRCLIAHPINPPYVIPLVEMVPAPWTAEESVTRCWALMEAAGMEPVRLTREIDGFIANRLQAALLWEAFRLLEGGYATAEDIDTTISAGLGRRWSFIGPFETIDLNAPGGLADFCARLGEGFFEFVKQGEPAEPWSDAVVAKAHEERRGRLPMTEHGDRQAWRDRRLMGLAAHLPRRPPRRGRLGPGAPGCRPSVAVAGERLAQLPQAPPGLLVARSERARRLAALVEIAAGDAGDVGGGREMDAGARAGLHVDG